ncbi:Uncharacterised protein [Bordetella pertussis]|nr:Uncharacterised protein [Bordetella pertussis]
MRSMRSPPSWRSDACICARPAARPLVHTLVATKARWRRPASASSRPVTASARPYIGELSNTVPPAANKVRTTSPRASYSAEGRATSKPM